MSERGEESNRMEKKQKTRKTTHLENIVKRE